MSDSLSKQVAKFMQNQPERRSGKARAAVIAMREEIQGALDDGWSVMAIWQTVHAAGSLRVGYHAFRRYVAELVVVPPAGRGTAELAAPSHPSREAASTAPARPLSSSGEARSFQHHRVPQKREIYG